MIYTFDDYELDTQLFELRHRGEVYQIEPQVFDVLWYLVDNRDRVVSKEEIFHEIWGDRIVTESALSSRLKAARKAIGDSGREQRLIKTLHGRGYRFIGSVEVGGTERATLPAPDLATRVDESLLTHDIDAVGRDKELAVLSASFERADQGHRQAVFITGEAGLGKTTLVETFLDQIVTRSSPRVLLGHCLEHHGQGEAYLPLLEAIGRACKQDNARHILDLLRQRAPTWLIELPALVDAEEMRDLRSLSRGMTRERMMREMVEAFEELATREALILVLEDLHWSDASTVDLVAWLAQRNEPARLLVVGTYRAGDARSEAHPIDRVVERLRLRNQARGIPLSFFDESTTREYLTYKLPGATIPVDLAELLRTRTDGNPLFMGSVIDQWIDQGSIEREGDTWRVTGDLDALCCVVPESLRLLIERRLLDLGAKDLEILEAGSVAGPEFPAAVVATIVDATADHIESRCAELARAGTLLAPCGSVTWPDGTVSACFRFQHSLFQEVLYERVPPGRRASLHAAIGSRLVQAYGAQARERASQLASHFSKGGRNRQAVEFHLQAAHQALRRLAQAEARIHLETGLELLVQLPPNRQRDELELSFQTTLAPTLIALEGFSCRNAEAAFARARELCEILGDTRQLSAVIYGLAIQCELRGEFTRSQTLMEQRLDLADGAVDRPVLEVETYDLLACSHFHQAQFPQALRLAEAGIDAFSDGKHSPTASNYGENPSIGCHGWAGLSLWFLGFPDRALEIAQRAVALSKRPGQTYSLSNSKMQVAGVCQLRRETGPTRSWSEETIRNARADGFVMRAAMGQLYKGWADAVELRHDSAIRTLREGLETLDAIGVRLDRPYFLGLFAEGLALLNRGDEAFERIAEALDLIEQPQSHFFEAELYRLRGEVVLQNNDNGTEVAEESFRHSLELAQKQEARSIELRAAMSLARLFERQGRAPEAGDILGPVHEAFTEGLETPDLLEAKTLLSAIT